MGHRILSHTADTGIEATADSLPALIAEVMRAMFGLIAALPTTAVQRWVAFDIEAATVEDLLVDTLSELLYRSEIEDLVFCDYRVEVDSERLTAAVEAGGVTIADVTVEGPPIKAVTYHGLIVERRESGWFGRVYFDV